MIRIYVYDKASGLLIREDYGLASHVMHDIKDNMDFTLTPPPDYVHVWRWVEDKWVADEPEPVVIEELQATVWELIKVRRLQAVTSGVYVESVDKWFHTDEVSVTSYSTIAGMIALDNYEPVQWKTMDNTWLLLTESLFKELQTAMSVKTNANYTVAEMHKAAMLKATNPLEYDYSEGWI